MLSLYLHHTTRCDIIINTMELVGNIESIVFRNAENGYTVAHVATPKRVTCVGIFPPVTEGDQ